MVKAPIAGRDRRHEEGPPTWFWPAPVSDGSRGQEQPPPAEPASLDPPTTKIGDDLHWAMAR